MLKFIFSVALSALAAQTAHAQPLLFDDTINPAPAGTIAEPFTDFFADEAPQKNLRQEGFALRIRVLERYTDTTQDFTIFPQEAVIYHNNLLIRAESCVIDFNEIPSNDGGYLTIENREGEKLFEGWVFKSFPSLTVFEHPDYDVLVLGCSVK